MLPLDTESVLLVGSPRPGLAQRATNPGAPPGAVIGKALGPPRGRGAIPVLVTLR